MHDHVIPWCFRLSTSVGPNPRWIQRRMQVSVSQRIDESPLPGRALIAPREPGEIIQHSPLFAQEVNNQDGCQTNHQCPNRRLLCESSTLPYQSYTMHRRDRYSYGFAKGIPGSGIWRYESGTRGTRRHGVVPLLEGQPHSCIVYIRAENTCDQLAICQLITERENECEFVGDSCSR
ncbi:hypothetical protein BDW67DRAFT_37752 [Aspergillus spinulosporus]